MNVVKHIICELTGYRPGAVDVSQGDRGSRAVSCRLLENGAPWMIPEGASVRVAYTLPDGTEGLYDALPDGSPAGEIVGNIVTVELADQLMDQAGMAQVSILLIGPDGGQIATWPIRVMVSANKAARLTVPENMPPYGAGFAGKIFFGGADGTVTPLALGDGVAIVRQEDGSYVLVAAGAGNATLSDIFIVTVAIDADTNAVSADRTVPEILEAARADKYVFCKIPIGDDYVIIPLVGIDSGKAVFTGMVGQVLGTVELSDSGNRFSSQFIAGSVDGVPPDESGNIVLDVPRTPEDIGALPAGTKIPAKTSDLSNDSGFITKSVADLVNYYTKTQTAELITQIPKFRISVVQQLPTVGEELVLYLLPFATAEGQYLEYIWVGGRFEVIGSQRVDLTGYATEEWVQEYVEEHSGQNPDLTGYATEQWVRDYSLPQNLGAENVGKVLVVGGDGNIVLTELPQGGDVTGTLDENNNILLSGDLAEGTYALKWKNADGTYSDAGTIVVAPVEPEATNYFDASTALLNHRLGSSGSPSAYDGMVVTDFIPVDSFAPDDILAISGVTLVESSAYNYARRTVWYNAGKSKIADNNGIDYDARYTIPVQPEAGGASYLRVAMVIKDGAALTASDIADLKIALT